MDKKIWLYIIFILLLVNFLVYLAVFQSFNKDFQIIACDVGQGDAFIIQKDNLQIVIDGGPANKLSQCISKYVSFWDREIEMMVLSHPQADHFTGLLDLFKTHNVEFVLMPDVENDTEGYKHFVELLEKENSRLVYAEKGQKMQLGEIELAVLHPPEGSSYSDLNEYSVVLLATYQDFDALFTGDISPEISDQLASIVPNIELLKVPHHGSKNGLSQKLLDALGPEIALISAGEGNRFGHPHKEIIEMLQSKNIKVYRTDTTGDVVIPPRTDQF